MAFSQLVSALSTVVLSIYLKTNIPISRIRNYLTSIRLSKDKIKSCLFDWNWVLNGITKSIVIYINFNKVPQNFSLIAPHWEKKTNSNFSLTFSYISLLKTNLKKDLKSVNSDFPWWLTLIVYNMYTVIGGFKTFSARSREDNEIQGFRLEYSLFFQLISHSLSSWPYLKDKGPSKHLVCK